MLPYAERYYNSIEPIDLTEEQKENFRQEVKKYLLEMESAKDAETDIRVRVTDITIQNAIRNNWSPKDIAESIML